MSDGHLSLTKGQRLFTQGDRATHFFKVISGCVRTFVNQGNTIGLEPASTRNSITGRKYRPRGSGRYRLIDAFYLPGDFFALHQHSHYRCSADAAYQARVLRYDRSKLEMMLRHDDEMLQSALEGLERARQHILSVGRRRPLEKTAAFLIDICERLDGTGEIKLPMSRKDMGDYLGLRIETLSRMLSLLECAGMIAVGPGHRVIAVLDKDNLRAASAQPINHSNTEMIHRSGIGPGHQLVGRRAMSGS